MKLLSVNVSQPIEVPYQDGTLVTGIYKEARAGRVKLHETNLDGDGQADLKHHGGRDKAVYCYPHEHYAYWQAELGREDFSFGQFGENFTVEGLLEDSACIGNVYRVGEALLQVSHPRIPCYKLEHKMQEPGFIKRFKDSYRSGFYCAVLQTGMVGAGDAISLEQADPEQLSIHEVFDLMLFDRKTPARLERALRVAALPAGWRKAFRKELEQT